MNIVCEICSNSGIEYVEVCWSVPQGTRLDIEYISTDLRKDTATSLLLVTQTNTYKVTAINDVLQNVPRDLSGVTNIIMRYKAETILNLPGDLDFALRGLDVQYIADELRSLMSQRYDTPQIINETLTDGVLQMIALGDRDITSYYIEDDQIFQGNTTFSIDVLAREISIYGISSINIIWTIPEGIKINDIAISYDGDIDGIHISLRFVEINFLPSWISRGG
jgi:hypothetical protein